MMLESARPDIGGRKERKRRRAKRTRGNRKAGPLNNFAEIIGGRHKAKSAARRYLVSRLAGPPQIAQNMV